MDFTFLTGLIGSLILVLGAAWPEPKKIKHPTKSLKNWLFAIGGIFMLVYGIENYLIGGTFFFVLLEILVFISTILMMLKVDDRIDALILSIFAAAFVTWSLFLFKDYSTIIFILGLLAVSLGYAFDMGTIRRDTALTAGSSLISAFSYLEGNTIFFLLNLFFAIFSGYYLLKRLLITKHTKGRIA